MDEKKITNRQRVEAVKKALKDKFKNTDFLVARANPKGKVYVDWIDGPSVAEVLKTAGETGLISEMKWKRAFSREKAQILIDQLVKDGAAPDLFEITRSHWCKAYLPRVICAHGANREMDNYRNRIGRLIEGWSTLIS